MDKDTPAKVAARAVDEWHSGFVQTMDPHVTAVGSAALATTRLDLLAALDRALSPFSQLTPPKAKE